MGTIYIEHLTKDYGNNRGIFDLSFSVKEGEIFGFLGPNGAGKTTTIRHLMGFTKGDIGVCTINDLDCRTNSAIIQKNLGYLPGEISFMESMTGLQFIKFMAELRGLKDFTRMEDLIKRFELDAKGKIKKMSKGMKQKIGIVCAFMHDPDILILDEPTSGLDPLMQNKFVELILEEKKRGKTILMSSHMFEEVEKTCDKIGMIKDGRLIEITDSLTIKGKQKKSYIVTFYNEEECREYIIAHPKCKNIDNNTIKINVLEALDELIESLTPFHIKDIEKEKENLEDIFLHYYGGEKND